MKNLLVLPALVAVFSLFAADAKAISVSASAALTGSGAQSVTLTGLAANNGNAGTLTVSATGNFPKNIAVFAGLDSVAVGSLGRVDLSAGSLPGVATLTKVFTLSGAVLDSLLSDGKLVFKFNSASPAAVSATLTYAPEPATLAMLGMGAVGLVGFARRRKLAA